MATTVQIFIASSSELTVEREAFRNFISKRNDRLQAKGIYVRLQHWEHHLDALSQTRLQDEYNQTIRESQIVVCLFHTKAGKYTQEEFDTALDHFKKTGGPLIYTYFKNCDDPGTETEDLKKFKDKLKELGHFYSRFADMADLENKFLQQLDFLEEKGLIGMQEEVKQQTAAAVNNYFNNSVVIQVSGNIINVNLNEGILETNLKLDKLLAMLEGRNEKKFIAGDKSYSVEELVQSNFGLLLGRNQVNKNLPEDVQHFSQTGEHWTRSLYQEFLKHGVSVGRQPQTIFQHYGWLIEAFLQKLETPAGKERNVRRLSFLAEAYQSTLRYLAYIQASQLLQRNNKEAIPVLSTFTNLASEEYIRFDYLNLLLVTTGLLPASDSFMPEINGFVEEISDTKTDLHKVAVYLDSHREELLQNPQIEEGRLQTLLDDYFAALVYWLRKLSFLCKYRLVSVKDIQLSYWLGTSKNFVHLYGELHGMYGEVVSLAGEEGDKQEDYTAKSIEDVCTFNRSILLFRGTNVSASLDNIRDSNSFISLSPLLIDQSVFSGKPTQTPDIYYYTGANANLRQYYYAQYKNELQLNSADKITSNKGQTVKAQNMDHPRLNELFEQLETVFASFKKTVTK